MALVRGNNSLFFATAIDNSGLRQGTVEAQGILRGLSNMVSKSDIFGGLAVGAAYAFYNIANEAYNMSKEFEKAMKEVQTISSATQKDFDGMSNSIIELSKKYPQSAKELANAMYEIVSSGYDGADGLKLLEVAAQSAVGGVTDAKTAADALTTVLNSWSISAQDSTKVADVFFKTVELGKTTFPELSKQIADVAPVAASMGVSFEEVGAAIATLTKQGTPTAVAMTQICAALTSMNEKLGDGWHKTMTLQQGMVKFNAMAGGSYNQLAKLSGRIESVGAFLAMTGKNAQMAASDLDAMNNSLGSTSAAFETMMQTNINKMQLLANTIVSNLKPIGDWLIEKGGQIADNLNKIFESEGLKSFLVETTKNIPILQSFIKGVEAGNFVFTKLVNTYIQLGINLRKYTDTVQDSKKKFEELSATETSEMNNLFDLLGKTNQGTEERKKAIETINTQYKDYLPNLLSEKSSLNDIEYAQIAANEAMIKSIALKEWELTSGEIMKQSLKDQKALTFDLISTIKEKNNAEVSGVANIGLRELIENYKNAKTTVDEFGKSTSQLGYETDALGKSQKSILIDDFAKKYNISASEVESSVIKIIDSENRQKDAIGEIDKYYKSLIGTLKTVKNAKTGIPIVGNELTYLESLKKQLEEYNKELEKLSNLAKDKTISAEDKKQIDAQNEKIKLKKQEIEFVEKSLNINQKETKVKEEQYKAIKGSLAYNEEQLKIAQEQFKYETNSKMKAAWADKIKSIQEEIDKQNDLLKTEKKAKEVKKDLSEMSFKELNEELRLINSKIEGLDKTTAAYQKLYTYQQSIIKEINQDVLQIVSTVNSSLSTLLNSLSITSDDLKERLNGLLNSIEALGSGIANVTSGNYIGVASDVLKLFSNLQKLFATRPEYNPLADYTGYLDELSQKQTALISSLGKYDKIKEIQTAYKELALVKKLFEDKIQITEDDLINIPEGRIREAFVEAITGGGGFISADDPVIKNIFDTMGESLGAQFGVLLTGGIQEADLAGTIADAFAEGKTSVDDFASYIEETLQTSVLEIFKNEILNQGLVKEAQAYLQTAFYDENGKFNGLSDEEIAKFKELSQDAVEKSKAIADQLQIDKVFATKDDNAKVKTLTGAIQRSLTEETGSILAGTLNSIRVDVRSQLNVTKEMNDKLKDIAYYSKYLERLVSIENLLRTQSTRGVGL